MRYTALFAVLIMSILAFGGDRASAQSAPAENKQIGKKQVEVRSGDTLIKIAKSNKTTYPRLFDANTQIKDPDVILAGQKVRIPHASEKLKKRPLATAAPVVQVSQTTSTGNYQPKPMQNTGPQVSGGVWDRLAACESGGNWAINTGNGYYGGLQFNLGTWQSNGGKGYPHQASKAEQIRVAENLRAARGFSPWPGCSAKLGLR